MNTPFLPRTVIVLGLVSFLNDTVSEMITPLLPIFLTASLEAGPAIVGLVEWVAEATASLLKLVSGRRAVGSIRHDLCPALWLELFNHPPRPCLAASLAATEGAERALIGDFARREERVPRHLDAITWLSALQPYPVPCCLA